MWTEIYAHSLRRDVALSELTTVRSGGRARWFYSPTNAQELAEFLKLTSLESVPTHILGGGSNLLPPDGEVSGVVIHPAALQEFSVRENVVRVGAGLPLSILVARASDFGLSGVHALAGIPGQVGGAVAMNAGGRYGDVSGTLASVDLLLPDGKPLTLRRDEVVFHYRHTELPLGSIVVAAEFRLKEAEDKRAIKRETGRILKEKNAVQPTNAWNFGCIFKNPAGTSAGKVLDDLGMKGLERGQARISPVHANFLENLGGASSADLVWLIEACEERARAAGIPLEREVRVWKTG